MKNVLTKELPKSMSGNLKCKQNTVRKNYKYLHGSEEIFNVDFAQFYNLKTRHDY